MSDMKALSENQDLSGITLEQVQDFTPTPMTRSSVAYYTGVDPKTLKNIFVERNPKEKQRQKSFFFKKEYKMGCIIKICTIIAAQTVLNPL